MRQVIFDTETTGRSEKGAVCQDHRVIEIGCIELENRRPTGRHFHVYLNPERPVDEEAFKVHGLSDTFLAKQPTFAQIADDFLAYLQSVDELIAHNLPFDQAFLNQEFKLIGNPTKLEKQFTLTDTLTLARQQFPGQRNSLDALCKRFDIDNSKRELHGALLDAQLLAEVYLKLTGGQTDLSFNLQHTHHSNAHTAPLKPHNWRSATLNAQEQQAHQTLLDSINPNKTNSL